MEKANALNSNRHMAGIASTLLFSPVGAKRRGVVMILLAGQPTTILYMLWEEGVVKKVVKAQPT